MEVSTSEFVISSTTLENCPPPNKPEYAFIGRSNVGKSSLINMICSRKGLAKISQTPGKTQLINHFLINKNADPWYLVDLPGYGFAKVPKNVVKKWLDFTKLYLRKRENLMGVFVLVDSRHKAQRRDLEFMQWLGENQIPFVMVFTKVDKLSSAQKNRHLELYKKDMMKVWESMPTYFHTSGETGLGRKEVLEFIDQTNKVYHQEV